MNKAIISLIIAVVSIMGIASPAFAANIPSAPSVEYPLVDEANILSPSEEDAIVARLTEIRNTTEYEYAVVIVSSLEGESIDDFSRNTANAWGIGDAENNDGVLLAIAMDERELRLEVGSGLSEIISDARAENIVNNTISPYLSNGEYEQGIIAGFDDIESLILSPVIVETPENVEDEYSWGFIIVVSLSFFLGITIVFFIIVNIYDKRKAKRVAAEKEERRLKQEAYYASDEYAEAVAQDRKRREAIAQLERQERRAIKERMRIRVEKQNQLEATRRAESKAFYDSLSDVAKQKINDTNTTKERQTALSAEIKKAHSSGALNGSTTNDNALLHTVMSLALFNTITGDIYSAPRPSSSGNDSSANNSSDSYRSHSSSSYDSGSSSSYDSGSSFGGGSFDGGGSSGSF